MTKMKNNEIMYINWGFKEYAGYLHDIAYLNRGINEGAFSLFCSNKTLAADWALAGRQLYLSLNNGNLGGTAYGIGITTIATYKSPFLIFRLLGIKW